MTFERAQQLQERDRREAAERVRRDGEERRRPEMLDESNPEHWIYPMPTVEEVVAAGYRASYHDDVAKQRAEMVQQFRADPERRAAMIRDCRAAFARGA